MTGLAQWVRWMGVKPMLLVLGLSLMAVRTASAAPQDHDPRQACLALIRKFDIFPDPKAGTPAPDGPATSHKPGAYPPALKRVERAAGQGNITAEAALGEIYREGRCGLNKDPDKALELAARAGGYFDIARMYMDERQPVQAYKWFRIGLMKEPWYTAGQIRLTLRQAGVTHPTRAQVQDYLDQVAMSKQVVRRRLALLTTVADMSQAQIERAERAARQWLKTHP